MTNGGERNGIHPGRAEADVSRYARLQGNRISRQSVIISQKENTGSDIMVSGRPDLPILPELPRRKNYDC
jgi:hypothetical protein